MEGEALKVLKGLRAQVNDPPPAGRCEGCGKPSRWDVCLACIRVRARAAHTKRCECGSARRPRGPHRSGSRRWVSCGRCLGVITQLRDYAEGDDLRRCAVPTARDIRNGR